MWASFLQVLTPQWWDTADRLTNVHVAETDLDTLEERLAYAPGSSR